MAELEPGQARITHPDPGVADSIVPASAVPLWERVGWQYVEGDREHLPKQHQRFEGQAQVRIYHPELDRVEVVAASAVPQHRANGWLLADEVEAEQLEDKTVAELRDLAKERGVKPIPATKEDLVAALQDEQDTEQAGEEPAPPSEEE